MNVGQNVDRESPLYVFCLLSGRWLDCYVCSEFGLDEDLH